MTFVVTVPGTNPVFFFFSFVYLRKWDMGIYEPPSFTRGTVANRITWCFAFPNNVASLSFAEVPAG